MSSSISSFEITAKEASLGHRAWCRALLKGLAFVLVLFSLDFGLSKLLDRGLQHYFGMAGHVDVLCVGHSRTLMGIDADQLSKLLGAKVSKFAVPGANTLDRDAMVRYFLVEHPEVKLLIYDVESSSFSDEKLSSNSYRLFFPFMGSNTEMDDYLIRQCGDKYEFWKRKILRSSRYDELTFSFAMRGLMDFNKNLKYTRLDVEQAWRWIKRGKTRPVAVNMSEYAIFVRTLEFAQSQGVKVLLVDMPTADILNQVEWPDSEKVRVLFRALPPKYENVLYLDLSRAYERRHEIFHDMTHLNAEGRKIVTEEISSSARAFLGNGPLTNR